MLPIIPTSAAVKVEVPFVKQIVHSSSSPSLSKSSSSSCLSLLAFPGEQEFSSFLLAIRSPTSCCRPGEASRQGCYDRMATLRVSDLGDGSPAKQGTPARMQVGALQTGARCGIVHTCALPLPLIFFYYEILPWTATSYYITQLYAGPASEKWKSEVVKDEWKLEQRPLLVIFKKKCGQGR